MKFKPPFWSKIVWVLFAISVGTTDATTINLEFTVGDFVSANGHSAPANFVSGSLLWEAASIHDPVLSFDSITLNIDGHMYTTSELAYERLDFPYSGIEVIGGKLNGVNSLVAQTDDFWIRWDRNNLVPFDFVYSTSGAYDFWSAFESGPGTFTSFSITEVPDQSVTFPAVCGLFALVICRVWRTEDKQNR